MAISNFSVSTSNPGVIKTCSLFMFYRLNVGVVIGTSLKQSPFNCFWGYCRLKLLLWSFNPPVLMEMEILLVPRMKLFSSLTAHFTCTLNNY